MDGCTVGIRLLGPIEVTAAGQPVVVEGRKPRALLAALLVRHGQPVGVDELVEVLWGHRPPCSVRGLIHTYVSTLRGVFSALHGAVTLTRAGNGYRLDAGDGWFDVADFEDSVRRATEANDRGAHDVATGAARRALALWRGNAFDGQAQGFLVAEAARLAELRRQAAEQYAAAEIALGQNAVIVPELRRFVTEFPLCERLREALIVSLRQAGQHAAALTAFEDTRRVLAVELGVGPGRRLMELHRDLLAADAVAHHAPRQ